MHMKRFAALATMLTLVTGVLPGPGSDTPLSDGWGVRTARAQETEDPEITAMAKQHYKLGQDAYAAGKYDVAIRELKKAHLLKRIPAILINIAMTYRKTKDFDMSIYFYKKYLAEAPPDDKQRPKIEQDLAETMKEKEIALAPQQLEPAKPAFEMAPPAGEAAKPVAEAAKPVTEAAKAAPGAVAAVAAAVPKAGAEVAKPVAEVGKTATETAKTPPAGTATAATATTEAVGGAMAQATPAAPAPEKAPTEWSHAPIDAAPPGQPIDVRVQMPVMKGVKVKVFYRRDGQATFESMELKRRGNIKVARLPAETTAGRTLQYYIEARDAAGTLVKSAGSEYNPNVVLVEAGARSQLADAQGAVDTSEDDEPAKRAVVTHKRDIENEAVVFDIGAQKKAQDRSRQQRGGKSSKKALFSPMGWAGVAAAGLGVAGLATGGAFLGLASNNAQIVSADSRCDNPKMKCLFYGPNDDPTLNKAPATSSSELDAQGRMFDKIGIAGMAAGGALLAVGGGLVAYDLIRRNRAERATTPGKAKVAKLQKTDHLETVVSMAPVLVPGSYGFVLEGRF